MLAAPENSLTKPTVRIGSVVFCKEISVESETEEITLKGTMTRVGVQLFGDTPPSLDVPVLFRLPMIDFCLYIELETEGTEESTTELSFTPSVNGRFHKERVVPIYAPPGKFRRAITIKLSHQKGMPLHIGSQEFSVTFRHNGQEVGKACLSIDVEVLPLEHEEGNHES
jgi:hypothetical protein